MQTSDKMFGQEIYMNEINSIWDVNNLQNDGKRKRKLMT